MAKVIIKFKKQILLFFFLAQLTLFNITVIFLT